MRRHIIACAALALTLAAPARAEITATAAHGFALRHTAEVAATPEAAWEVMVRPGLWWNSEHTYSGDAASMTIAPVAGGCFCETVPPGPLGPVAGTVEHMRVVFAMPGRKLRMSGGLGPLQAEALTGVLTASFEPIAETGGTRITWDYVVGGFMRHDMAEIAPLVDAVIGEQHSRLVAHISQG